MDNRQANQVLCENISKLRERERIIDEQRSICLSLLSSQIREENRQDSAEAVYRAFCQSLPDASGKEKLTFCRSLLQSPEELLAIADDTAAGSHGKVAYVKNRYNDAAFELFSKKITNAKSVSVSSFADACEETFDNRCEFCIVPLENTYDGKLFGFYSMLDRYELKIVDCAEIETDDPSKLIRFALVRRGISSRSFNAMLKRHRECIFEFSIAESSGAFMTEVLSAVTETRGVLTKVDSLPVQYDDRQRRFFFTVSLPPRELSAFCLYLTLEFSSYTFIGLYPPAAEK